ncbi:hypothetical protein JYG34_12780 [Pseudomonas entomophila]|uniref:hypothetical protein n=1 Tax=Pseudomonas entomophila TaxID=312306 RepID=UPI001BCC49E6|nr:hypothetical protein [Pseudomonas entomophila]QVM93825.1 hypothetical protein JYG34_12780 [Pseudomonas entomophila]
MKPLLCALTLLTMTSMTTAFAEGGADRLKERSDQWALQRQQAQQTVAKELPRQDQHRAEASSTGSSS